MGAGSGTPLITVVTVVYNRVDDMQATLDNVCRQNRMLLEYVVVDGQSKDGTVELIRQNEDRIDHWVSERDQGIYDAMNKGIRLAQGEWIVFMNAGDLFYDDTVLETCAPYLREASAYQIVYGDAEIVEGERRHIQWQQDRHLDLTKSIIHQSMFIRTDYLRANLYDTRYRIMADYDNLLKVSGPTPEKCKHIPVTICRYDKTGVSSRPLYTYFKEYYSVARRRMSWMSFIRYNLYIFPRLIWSFRFMIR